MGICVFLYNQKLQRVDAGEIAPSPPPPPSSLPAPPPPSLPAYVPLDVVEELEKLLARTKMVAELKRQLAEAIEDPTPTRSTWNSLF
jgi:hypothetical protein